jgi:hypothetical protein
MARGFGLGGQHTRARAGPLGAVWEAGGGGREGLLEEGVLLRELLDATLGLGESHLAEGG